MSREAMKLALEAMERYQVKRQDFDRFADEITALQKALANEALDKMAEPAQQKPVFTYDQVKAHIQAAMMSAAQRPWVGLTLERKMDMAESYFTDEWAINRAIQLLSGCENALKEKNT